MPILGYWRIRGLAQPVRLLLNFLELPCEEKLYQKGYAPDFSAEAWLKEKYSLGLAFPNLPYYIDGETKLTQSSAIMRHFGRKYDMVGETDAEKDLVNMLLDHIVDIRQGMEGFTYGLTEGMTKEKYYKELPEKLAVLEKHLADKPWFVGQKPTIADFPIYEVLDQHVYWERSCLNDFPRLQAFQDRFRALPTIKAYMESERFMKTPVNDTQAIFIE